MKDKTIKKIFGVRLQGSVGLALALLNRASMINWEVLWPQFQSALIGLGVGAIAFIEHQAIAKGLTDLAQRIAAFQPVASPTPGETLTRAEAMPVPYVPLAPTIPSVKYAHSPADEAAFDAIQDEINDLARELEDTLPPEDPCKRIDLLEDRMKEVSMRVPSSRWGIHVEDWVPSAWLYLERWYSDQLEELRRHHGCKTREQRSEEAHEKWLQEHPEERVPF